MNILNLLTTRKSTRNFTYKPISREIINTILTAGALAPSISNIQPWRYIVLTDNSILENLTHMTFTSNASATIVCLMRKDAISDFPLRAKELITSKALSNTVYEKIDTSIIKSSFNDHNYVIRNLYLSMGASIQQMSLMATNLNIDSCFISLFDENLLIKRLNISDEYEVLGLLAIGYENLNLKSNKSPRIPLNEIVLNYL
ncbi:MAG: nitroreductase family protein [Clostridiaceae bacterium]